MKETRFDRAPKLPGTSANPVSALPGVHPDREALKALAQDIVKYCPHLAQMLVAVRKCPPHIGLN